MNELILVVDDEPKIVKLARDYLEQGGFRIVTAADGMTALAVAHRERPDLKQTACELLRPIVLFGDPATGRAKETDEPRPTLERKADAFDEQGMVSLFAARPRKQSQETARSLPPDMRQLIVDLRVDLPTMSLREIAEICEARFDRRPSHNSVKMVLASGPPPSINTRRYPIWEQILQPAE